MLVRAFEVEIGRPLQPVVAFEREGVRAARVEPDVEDVGHLLEVGGIVFVAEEALGRALEPGIRALGAERLDDAAHHLGVAQRLAGLLVDEHRDRHAPGALARDVPVRPRLDHRAQAVVAGARHEACRVDRRQRLFAQGPADLGDRLIHGDEPLRRVAEDDRRLGAPGMRIGVGDATRGEQLAHLVEQRDGGAVGVALLAVLRVDALAREQRHMRIIRAVLGHRVRHFHAVGDAQLVVVGAMARRDVHEARAGIGRHEVPREQAHVEFEAMPAERMRSDQAFQIIARNLGHDLRRELRFLGHRIDQLAGQHQPLADAGLAAFGDGGDFDQRVGDVAAVGERAVARHGPGRRRPDHDRSAVELAALRRHDREADMDRVRRMVVILDLGLGQRGLLDHRPQHRLRALVETAIHQELAQFLHDDRLGLVLHRRVVIVPVAVDAEALELLALDRDPVIGEGAALAAELDDRNLVLVLLLGAVLFLDLPLDRQAVAVPARDVVAVLAQHLLGARDEVLQDLVERVADVEIAVGVGRAVVQHELRPPLALDPQPVPQLHVGPALQELGLLLRQARAHGKVGLRQENA